MDPRTVRRHPPDNKEDEASKATADHGNVAAVPRRCHTLGQRQRHEDECNSRHKQTHADDVVLMKDLDEQRAVGGEPIDAGGSVGAAIP